MSEGTTKSERSSSPRNEGPYCWQAKAALRKISEDPLYEKSSNVLLLYLGLCWHASDVQSNTFQISRKSIRKKIGLCERTIDAAIPELERLELVRVGRNRKAGSKEWDVHVYTLLTVANGLPEGSEPDAIGYRKRERSSNARKRTTRNLPKGDSLYNDEEIEIAPDVALASPLEVASGADGANQNSETDALANPDWGGVA